METETVLFDCLRENRFDTFIKLWRQIQLNTPRFQLGTREIILYFGLKRDRRVLKLVERLKKNFDHARHDKTIDDFLERSFRMNDKLSVKLIFSGVTILNKQI